MRENRTYGLTRGRSGSAASLYSTGKYLFTNEPPGNILEIVYLPENGLCNIYCIEID
jgi:hypothetical protein